MADDTGCEAIIYGAAVISVKINNDIWRLRVLLLSKWKRLLVVLKKATTEMWVAIEGCVVLVDALEHKILALLSLLLVVFDHNLQRTFGFQDVEFFIYGRPGHYACKSYNLKKSKYSLLLLVHTLFFEK